MAAKSEKAIRESLMTQLRAKGADVSHFEGLVDDYVEYFRLVKKMKADIKKRGLSYTATSAAGKEYEKDNPNVKLLPQYTRAMLTILKDLGLTTDKVAEEDIELWQTSAGFRRSRTGSTLLKTTHTSVAKIKNCL